jgi:hypothetical protein
LKRLRAKITYANVMVTVLAFAVLAGGTAYAATEMLPKNSVGTKQLAKEAVTPAKLSKASKATLTGPAGPTGATGPIGPAGTKGEKGDRGDKGETGAPATSLWAVVSAGAKVLHGKGVTEVKSISTGEYEVVFNQDVSACAYSVTPFTVAVFEAEPRAGNANGVFVAIQNTAEALVNTQFYLSVFC